MAPLMTTGRFPWTYFLKKTADGGSSIRPTFPCTEKGTSEEAPPPSCRCSRRTFHAMDGSYTRLLRRRAPGRVEGRLDHRGRDAHEVEVEQHAVLLAPLLLEGTDGTFAVDAAAQHLGGRGLRVGDLGDLLLGRAHRAVAPQVALRAARKELPDAFQIIVPGRLPEARHDVEIGEIAHRLALEQRVERGGEVRIAGSGRREGDHLNVSGGQETGDPDRGDGRQLTAEAVAGDQHAHRPG